MDRLFLARDIEMARTALRAECQKSVEKAPNNLKLAKKLQNQCLGTFSALF